MMTQTFMTSAPQTSVSSSVALSGLQAHTGEVSHWLFRAVYHCHIPADPESFAGQELLFSEGDLNLWAKDGQTVETQGPGLVSRTLRQGLA
jgi:hypothetical protein